VGNLERFGNLSGDGERLVGVNGRRSDAVGERRPVDQFHDQRASQVPVRVAGGNILEPVDVRNVRMIQRREDVCFASKAGKAIRLGGDRRVENLDCDVPVQLGIACAINLSHTSGAEEAQDVVVSEPRPGSEGHRCD
jgi:hypothetical protein